MRICKSFFFRNLFAILGENVAESKEYMELLKQKNWKRQETWTRESQFIWLQSDSWNDSNLSLTIEFWSIKISAYSIQTYA